MSSQKHALFYSNYCKYSKELIDTITKRNVKHLFVFVCVDDNRYTLPKVVDRVPMIITMNKAVVSDESLLKFVNTLTQATEESISPFTIQNMGNTYSDSFSFISDETECKDDFCRGFVFVGDNAQVSAPLDNVPISDNKKDKFDASTFDKLISERDSIFSGQDRKRPPI